jgi:hypothetical protein
LESSKNKSGTIAVSAGELQRWCRERLESANALRESEHLGLYLPVLEESDWETLRRNYQLRQADKTLDE